MNMYVTILSNLPDSSLPLLQLAQVFRVQGDRWARPIQDLGFSSIEHFVEADVLQPGTWCTDRVCFGKAHAQRHRHGVLRNVHVHCYHPCGWDATLRSLGHLAPMVPVFGRPPGTQRALCAV
jgi:hypothetical protein